MADAQEKASCWVRDFTEARPDGGLGYQTPRMFRVKFDHD
jgi:hypothetical protein